VSGIAYNWEVSPSSTFAPVVKIGSTTTQTQDSVSGLPNGTYFWHVQSYDGAATGPWSATRSFTVTGSNSGELAPPSLNPILFGAAFHPLESFPFDWTPTPGAATYTVDASPEPNFSLQSEIHVNNIATNSYGLDMGESLQQGTWYLRVSAVSASGVYSQPSNIRTFMLSWNAPLPPAPTLLAPANGATVQLPVMLKWSSVPNPQNGGYEFQVATDPQFKNIEDSYNQNTDPFVPEPSLLPGTKYWHVRAEQGDSSHFTPAQTAWSATGTFVVGSHPTAATPSVTIASPFSGDTEAITVQLTAPAPTGGSVVTLTSSNPTAAPLPATVTLPAGTAFTTFTVQLGQITAATPVTLTESINGTSASITQTVQPPSLKEVWTFTPTTGGSPNSGIIYLNGNAPTGGAVVQLSSSNPSLVTLPATVTVLAGQPTLSFTYGTNVTPVTTPVTITATWNGVTTSTTFSLTATPPQAPAGLTLNPSSTTGSAGSTGTVTLATTAASDTLVGLTSGNQTVATVPASVVVPAGSASATFAISTAGVTTSTIVTIGATAGGVTRNADLTVLPAANTAVSLSSLTVSPTAVQGGASVTGTATLTAPAPAGGALVTLSSANTAVATLPTGITVPAGSTSATFTITTIAASASTPVTISATFGGTTRTTVLTVSGAPPVASDKVAVTLAEYDGSKKVLHVQATSTGSGAVLKAYVSSSGALVGTLTSTGGGKYESQFPWSANPGNITLKSSLGGTAALSVTAK
jgi:hypothetical protein